MANNPAVTVVLADSQIEALEAARRFWPLAQGYIVRMLQPPGRRGLFRRRREPGLYRINSVSARQAQRFQPTKGSAVVVERDQKCLGVQPEGAPPEDREINADPKRGTGRSTRMLLWALADALAGQRVVVVCRDATQARMFRGWAAHMAKGVGIGPELMAAPWGERPHPPWATDALWLSGGQLIFAAQQPRDVRAISTIYTDHSVRPHGGGAHDAG